MARRKNRNRSVERDHLSYIPNFVVRRPLVLASRSPVFDLEDRRSYHPLDLFRPALSIGRSDADVVERSPARQKSAFPKLYSAGLSFRVPKNVSVCARRHERREVLFAKGGLNGRKRKRRNYWSSISCKR